MSNLLNKFAKVLAVEEDRSTGARTECDVVILGRLEDEMPALCDYPRPVVKHRNLPSTKLTTSSADETKRI